MKKKLTVVAALLLVLAMGVGGTLAYLTDQSDTVTNTFTIGNVKISLVENQYDPANPAQAKKEDNKLVPVAVTNGTASQEYKLIPGTTYYKDPTVTVKEDSEACWLFVAVVEKNNPSKYLNYEINTGTGAWTALETDDEFDVYYIQQNAVTTDTSYSVLKDDKVKVKTTIGSDDMPETGKEPSLTFVAFAVQQANIDSVSDAWNAVKDEYTSIS